MVQGFILTLGYSRLSCVIPAFKQDLPTVIDCFERVWEFLVSLSPTVLSSTGWKLVSIKPIPTHRASTGPFWSTPTTGALCPIRPDPAHPKDKPVVRE